MLPGLCLMRAEMLVAAGLFRIRRPDLGELGRMFNNFCIFFLNSGKVVCCDIRPILGGYVPETLQGSCYLRVKSVVFSVLIAVSEVFTCSHVPRQPHSKHCHIVLNYYLLPLPNLSG